MKILKFLRTDDHTAQVLEQSAFGVGVKAIGQE